MSYVAIVGAVVSAGTAAYGAYSKGQAAKSAQGAISAKSAGTVPKAAEYQDVDVRGEQLHTIWDNYKALDNIIPMDARTNAYIDKDAMARAEKFVPGYKSAMDTYGRAGNDLLNARLPFSDVMDVVSKTNDLTNATGIPGQGGSNATLKDLGLSQLDAVKSGGGILKDMVGIAETVNPVGRRATPQQMMLNPSDRVNWAIQQAQLDQQSLQNKYNLAAAPDPASAQHSQLALAQAGVQAGGGGSGAGYANAAGQLVNGLVGAYAKSNTSGTPNYGNPSGAVPNYSGWSTGPQQGTYYVPKAQYYNGVVS